MAESGFFALFHQSGGGGIAPAAFVHEAIPDFDLLGIRFATGLKAPFQDFLVRTTFESALGQGIESHVEKTADAIIERAHARDKIEVIALGQFALLRIEADFIEDAAKNTDAADEIARGTKWECHAPLLAGEGGDCKRMVPGDKFCNRPGFLATTVRLPPNTFRLPFVTASMPTTAATTQLKDWFDEARYRAIARELARITPKFDAQRFLQLVLAGLADRTLMERLHQCAVAVDAALPGSFQQQVRVLQQLAPKIGHEFVTIFLGDFVATFGREDFDFSMAALRFFTVFGSAEFAVRPFIVADQTRALQTLLQWTQDADEKVRRLASEGSRPRLPWGMRLSSLVRDPAPTWSILEVLKDDESLFVRRSVANHLNDITKDHPAFVLERLEAWDLDHAHLSWIAKQACRTLIKRGNQRALKLFGFGKKAAVQATLEVTPQRLTLGERLTLTAVITSTSLRTQRLAIDYVVHYVKARGVSTEKVFKWTEVDLPARETLELGKTQVIRDFTTRKHHPGRHRVELQINGQRVAESAFGLQ